MLKNFITTLPDNRELSAPKNFSEQQGLNFLIFARHHIQLQRVSLVIIRVWVHLPGNIPVRGAVDTILLAFWSISKIEITCFNPAGLSKIVFSIIGLIIVFKNAIVPVQDRRRVQFTLTPAFIMFLVGS